MADKLLSSLRLFFSADIAGSTAFKNKSLQRSDGRPAWLSLYEGFFEDFGVSVAENWDKEHGVSESPQVWKLAGDEILLTQTISQVQDVAASVNAFRSALVAYQEMIRAKFDRSLGLKGTAWCAGFPVINSMIEVSRPEPDTGTKALVLDFIGPSVDAGFRLTRHADPARMVISHDLAWLLSKVPTAKGLQSPFLIYYDGDVVLKGIFGGRPYPLFTIDVGDSLERKRNQLAGRVACENEKVAAYVEAFVQSIDDPNLASLPYLFTASCHWGTMPESHSCELRKMDARKGHLDSPEPKDGQVELPSQKISQ